MNRTRTHYESGAVRHPSHTHTRVCHTVTAGGVLQNPPLYSETNRCKLKLGIPPVGESFFANALNPRGATIRWSLGACAGFTVPVRCTLFFACALLHSLLPGACEKMSPQTLFLCPPPVVSLGNGFYERSLPLECDRLCVCVFVSCCRLPVVVVQICRMNIVHP